MAEQAIDRIEAYACYLALLEGQLAALEEGDDDDMAAFSRLAEARDALARDLDARGAAAPEEAELLRPLLQRALDVDGRIGDRLRQLREITRLELSEVHRQKDALAHYRLPVPTGARLDRRS